MANKQKQAKSWEGWEKNVDNRLHWAMFKWLGLGGKVAGREEKVAATAEISACWASVWRNGNKRLWKSSKQLPKQNNMIIRNLKHRMFFTKSFNRQSISETLFLYNCLFKFKQNVANTSIDVSGNFWIRSRKNKLRKFNDSWHLRGSTYKIP